MKQESISLGGLRTILIEAENSSIDIVLLHGYAMEADDLAPFAYSMGIPARFFLPTAPLRAARSGYSWWNIDEEERLAEISNGPRDLAYMDPPDRRQARLQLITFCQAARQFSHNENAMTTTLSTRRLYRPFILCGFSQGGMLACDAVLCGDLRVDGLALLSSSRVALGDWQTQSKKLFDLPVLVSHGRNDPDLAFAAGEALKTLHESGGAKVTWVPFDGGHEIPLVVWRELRKFVRAIQAERSGSANGKSAASHRPIGQ